MLNLLEFHALTFDCYGTLIDWENGIIEALRPWLARNGLHVDRETLLEMFANLEPRHEALAPDKPYPDILRAVLADMAHQLQASVTAEDLSGFGRSVWHWPAFPDAPDALKYLQSHYKLVIISNIDRVSFAHSNAKLGVGFDAIITAEDVGCYKPEVRNFEYALERLDAIGVQKGRVLHVAQSLYHDHVPAKSLGLRTVWVNRRAGKPGAGAVRAPDVDVQPDLVVEDLEELVAIHRSRCRS